MGMSADHYVYALLHKENGPFFFVFGRHGLIFAAPLRHKDYAVADFLRLGYHGSYLFAVKNVDHVFPAFSGTGIICSVYIIKKRDGNSIDFQGLYCVRIFLSGMDSENGNLRIIGFPEVQSLRHIIIAIIVNVVGGGFDHIKPGFDQSVSYFCRRCKGRIAAYRIVVGGKDGFLIDHSYVRSLDLIQDVGINMIVIPFSGIVFPA